MLESEYLLALYLVGFAVTFVLCARSIDPDLKDPEDGAPFFTFLLAFVWPVAVPFFLIGISIWTAYDLARIGKEKET